MPSTKHKLQSLASVEFATSVKIRSQSSDTSGEENFATKRPRTSIETEKEYVVARKTNPFCQTLGEDIVQVHIGNGLNRKKFVLHKDRICTISSYFRESFIARQTEAIQDQLWLSDVDVGSFEAFVEWVYNGTFTLESPPDSSSCRERLRKEVTQCIDLYILADRFGARRLLDIVLDKWQDIAYAVWRVHKYSVQLHLSVTHKQVLKVFENTQDIEDHQIRKFCAMIVSHFIINVKYKFAQCIVEVGQIFSVPGFVKAYSCYLDSETDNSIDHSSEVRDNPAIRGIFKRYWVNGDILGGFSTCYFHVHKDAEPCTTIANYVTGEADGAVKYLDH